MMGLRKFLLALKYSGDDSYPCWSFKDQLMSSFGPSCSFLTLTILSWISSVPRGQSRKRFWWGHIDHPLRHMAHHPVSLNYWQPSCLRTPYRSESCLWISSKRWCFLGMADNKLPEKLFKSYWHNKSLRAPGWPTNSNQKNPGVEGWIVMFD